MTTISDLMTLHADRVPVGATLGEAARRMVEARISSVIVVDRDEVVGIVTERDMLHAMRLHEDPVRPVSSAMTSPVHTVQADLDFREAFRTAARLGIRHLVVCDPHNHPIGVVTETDFRRHLGLDFFRQLNTVDVLMEQTFPRLPATATLDEALLAMESVRGSCLVVVDGHRPMGIITERDVVRLYLEQGGNPLLGEVMTHPVASVYIDTPISEAAERMLVSHIRHLTVLDENERLVGMLTEHSLIRPLELDMVDDALAARKELSETHDLDLRTIARNERYQRALLDNFPFLVWLKDTESRFLAVNRPFAEAAGQLSTDFFAGKTDLDIWPRDLAEAYRQDDAQVLASGQPKYVVEPVVDRGVRNWFETYKAPVVAQDGVLLGTVGFARDVSDRMREEEATLIRNAALAGLLRGEPLAGVLELIALSLEAEIPGSVCAVFRLDQSGQNLLLKAAPSATELWVQAIGVIPVGEGCGASGTAAFRDETVVIEDVFTDPLGEAFRDFARQAGIISGCAVPVHNPSGELLGVFTIYHRQAGRANEHQEALLIQCSQLVALILTQYDGQAYLQNSLETFRGIFDSVDEALFVQAVDGVFLDINLAAARMFGLSPSELIGQTHECLAAEGLNDLELIKSCIRASAAGQHSQFVFWGRDACGRIFPAEVHLSPGSYFGEKLVIASVRDVTERNAAEQRLRFENDLAKALVSGMSRTEVMSTFLDIALRFPEFDCGGSYLAEPDQSLRLVVHRGLSEEFVGRVSFCPADSAQVQLVQAGTVICSTLNVSDCCTDLHLIHAEHLVAEGLSSLVIVPILIDGAVVGCLNLAGRRANRISKATYAFLENLSQLFSRTLLQIDAQEEARQLQKNLSGLFDTLQDFLFVLDAQGCIQHYNRVVIEGLGYTPTELIGQPVLAVHPEECHEMARQVVGEMLAGTLQSCPLPLLRRDGSTVTVETRVVAGFWNGEPALFGLSQDISARLLADERQKLAASVFVNAHEGIMITDPRGRIIDVNPTFSELTGFSHEEAVGQTTDLLKSGHHEASFYAEMWQAIQRDGFWRGEVWNRKKSGEIFVELLTISSVLNHLGKISHFVGIFSDITLLKEHQQRLEHLAHFDALTQLPNRMLLADRLHLAMAQTERNGKTLAIAYLDLDGFKQVNDELGHATGDRLLVEVALRLRQCVRAGDTISRLGGDEFVLLLSQLDDEQECDRAVTRVLTSLATPFHIAGRNIEISASIGVTLFPLDGSDADRLMRHADQAMYLAKQAGRNRYHLFDPESDRRAKVWREELKRVRQAFDDEEFVLHYQPKVNMREGRVFGAEALIRWQHPERGLLLPAVFLPAIEGSDLDAHLGKWVIRTALAQMEAWQAKGHDLAVSVNISGSHLLLPGFVNDLAGLLAAFPSVPPQNLELEILETAALEDMIRAAEVFAACRELGVTFALDDFGTGYSSLTYFRRLPADMLKIDQSFVRDMLEDPDDLAIVEGVIGLTHAFHRKVIAEGVETPEHGMMLLQLGCDLAQGFGIARPMPAEQLPAWARSFAPDELWNSVAGFKWSRDDLPLLVAEHDHQRWMRSLEEALEDSGRAAASLTLGHSECRFGRWYYGEAKQRYGKFDSFQEIEAIHSHLHELGHQLMHLKEENPDPELIRHCREELAEVSQRLSDTLQLLQAEVLMDGMRGMP